MIENLDDAINQLKDYFTEPLEKVSENQADDAISELADSNVDIYNSDLIEWAGKIENHQYVEDAIGEFGWNSTQNNNLITAYQMGQYQYNRELLLEAWEKIKAEITERE